MATSRSDKPHLAYPVLLVDDEQDNLDAFRFNFRNNFDLHTALSGEAGLKILRQHKVAVIVTDQRMPEMTGTEFLRHAREVRPDAVGIILTAFRDEDVLMEAIGLGHVYRYVLKPWDRAEMQTIVDQALERYHLQRENERLTAQLKQYAGYLEAERHGAFDYGQIIGTAPTLQKVLHQVEQVAPTASTVLLRGETGTGKELIAHAIHINSPREDRPFVKVNCAALAPGVLESELFGHEKGAFTGAIDRRVGRFELADSGTIFLDEVGDLPLEVQIKLLRVLQEREFERIGGPETVQVDVRLISATNSNLEGLISKGAFRRDLYYRLNVFPVIIPPLRERKEDIGALARHFVHKFGPTIGKRVSDLSDTALEKLMSYDWPGNVRELENVIERALILCQSETVRAVDLDFGPVSSLPTEPLTGDSNGHLSGPVATAADARPLGERLGEQERQQITDALERSAGNVAAAARSLGINRSTLYYRMRKHRLDSPLPPKK
jgi:two-component system, NtrC family, response regulator AtoC